MLEEADFADGRLKHHVGDLCDPAVFDAHRGILEETDFFFIDGPKDDHFEPTLWKLMHTVRFRRRPIFLFDDVRLWSMLRFWREIRMPKLDLVSFGHSSGTGLVEWVVDD